ncbi:MAG: DsbA family protein [Nanoarchaeota archaeon]|nr:DsbA family protein [Nanoarchaeota archaeon]
MKIKKTEILTWMVVVTLMLTLVNSYTTFNLGSKLDSITGSAVEVKQGEVKETQPLGAQKPALQPNVQVSVDDDPVKGSANAPVTIVEFSDFECPFCARFYEQTMGLIDENYIQTGKVKLVFRDFPLAFHENAQKASEAAECADEQGKFWEYHDSLFENQGEWSSIGVNKFKEYAQELGLNTEKFDACLDSGKYASEVQKDLSDGQGYGVSGTPTFFVNGIKIVGAQPYSAFQQLIEQELAK